MGTRCKKACRSEQSVASDSRTNGADSIEGIKNRVIECGGKNGQDKDIKRAQKIAEKSMVINGVRLVRHDPTAIFKNHKKIKAALAEALLDGDKEAFVEILAGYVRAHNILEVCRRTGLSRTVVYEAIAEHGNPSLDTLCKIMTSFNEVA